MEEVLQWFESSYRIPSIKKIMHALETSTYTNNLYPFLECKTFFEHNWYILDDSVYNNRYSSMLFNCNTVYLNANREQKLDGIVINLM